MATWLALLLSLGVVLHGAQSSWTSQFLIDLIPGLRTHNNVSDYSNHERYDNAMERLFDSVLAAHNLPSDFGGGRQRRSTSVDITIKDTLGVHRLQYLTPLTPLCERQLSVAFVPYAGQLYVICTSAGTKQVPPRMTVGTLTENIWKPLASTDCVDPTTAVGFTFNKKLYIVSADSGLEKGAELQFFDKDTKKIYIDHTINSARPTAVAFWQMKSTGEYNLALANSGKEMSTFIYSWKATYFDKYATVDSRMVCDIEPFSIHNSDFMVIVNQRFSSETSQVSTVVLKYHLPQSAWKPLQQIPTYAASDAEFFTMGRHSLAKEFYLAIANQYEQHEGQRNYAVDSVIYKYVDGMFVPFQCLHTTGATKMATFEGPNGEFLLAVASLYEPVHLYQYSGWHFVLTPVQYTQHTMGPGVRDLTFFMRPNDILLGVSNPAADGPGTYQVSFYHDNQIARWYDDSLSWCQESVALSSGESAAQLVSQLDDSFYVDRKEPIRISGQVVFQDLQVSESLRAPQFEELATGETYSIKNLQELENLQVELNVMKDTVQKMAQDFLDALKLTGDQTIAGNYHFDNLDIDCPPSGCGIAHLETDYLNKEDIRNLGQRLFFTHIPQSPNVPMSFDQLSVDNILVDGFVNGINVSSLVTVNQDHVLTGNIRFARPIHTKDVVMAGSLGTVTISPQHLMLTEGDQMHSGEITMTHAMSHTLQVDGVYNEINITKFYHEALTADGSHVITGRKNFQKASVDGTLYLGERGLFNNVNLARFWRNVMWTQGNQVVSAPHSYGDVHFGDVSVRDTVNGVLLPGPDVILVNQNVTVSAEKTFLGDCSVDELHVNVALNGLQRIQDPISDWKGQLDLLVKTPIQRITGESSFKTIYLNGDNAVGRFVDGVVLSDLANFMRKRHTALMNGTWTFTGKVVFLDKVIVSGLINGHKLNDLYNRALRLDAPVFPSYDRVIFANNTQVKNLICHDINGFDMSSSFVFKRGPKVLRGEKTFDRLRLTGDVTVKGLVSGANLGALETALKTHGNQVVRAPKVFTRNVHMKHLIVDNSINGVKLEELCRLDESCVFTAPKDFASLTVDGGVTVGNLVVRNRINGILAAELVEDTLFFTDTQLVTGTKTFVGNVTLPPNSCLQTSNFSGVNLAELYSDAVLINGDQVITGQKIFEATVAAPQFEFHSTLDGLTQAAINNWMLQGSDEVVTGDLIFENNLETIGHLEVGDTINEVNLKDLVGNIAYKNESCIFAGPVRFAFLGSMADVHVTGTVQGVDVSEQVVDRTKDVVVSGRKLLKSGFDVFEHLFVHGVFDSVKVELLCKRTVITSGEQVIVAPVTVIGDVSFTNGVKLGGLLDDVDIKELKTNCLNTDGDTVVRGTKKFRTLVVQGPLTVRGTLNGMNLKHLQHSYMSISKDQVIESKLRMPSVHIQGSMHCGAVHAREVNGVALPAFMHSVLLTTGNQDGTTTCQFGNVTFNDVTLHSMLNGVSLPSGVFSRMRSNVLAGSLEVLGNAKIRGTLTMPESARLQGVDVASWARNAVFNDGTEYAVSGTKLFTNLNITWTRVLGTLDGVKVSATELLLTTGDQVITGKMILQHDIAVADLRVAGYLNGINLHELIHKAMLKSRRNVVVAPKRFLSGFRVATLHTLGRVGSVSFQDLKMKTKSMDNLEALVMQLNQQRYRIDELNTAFKQQAVFTSYYEDVLRFTVGRSRSACYAEFKDTSKLFLLSLPGTMETSCAVLKKFMVKHGVAVLSPMKDTQIAEGSSIQHLSVPGADFIVGVNKKSARTCSHQAPHFGVLGKGESSAEIFLWNPSLKDFQLYQVFRTSRLYSVATFNLKSKGCFAAIADGYLKIGCVSDISEGFQILQDLQIHYSTGVAASYCQLDGTVVLAVTATQPGHIHKVFVYTWSHLGLKKLVSFPVSTVGTLAVIGHRNQCLLVVGQREMAGANIASSVYRYLPGSPSGLVEVQKLFIGDALSLDWLPSPDARTVQLFVHTGGRKLKTYLFKGASGFVEEDSVHIDEMFHEVRAFQRSDGRHLVTMSDSPEEPSTVVLVSKLKGALFRRD